MIKIENLTRYYGDFCAVHNLNLEIKQGEVLGLLGPNGAGKSTTLRIITGYLSPSGGIVSIDGLNVADNPLAIKKKIGYLPESAPLYHDMLVFDYLLWAAEAHGIASIARTERLKEMARLCQIENMMHKPIGELSKGYKQRVGLAFAMIGDPEILILDEPTSGLDPNQIVEIRSLIREIGKKKTIIFSTHILSEAEATCDRIVIINKGEIVANGTAADLRDSVQKSQTRLSVTVGNASFTDIKKVFSGVEGVLSIDIQDQQKNLFPFLIIGDRDLRKIIYRKIKEKEWILYDFRQETQSFEDIFRTLTQGDA